MKTKVYIAGKITGDQNYREKFGFVQKQLEAEGYIVLSPATLPVGMSTADYMRICFAMIDTADEIAFLDDYEKKRRVRKKNMHRIIKDLQRRGAIK